jgi:hypothetical protein
LLRGFVAFALANMTYLRDGAARFKMGLSNGCGDRERGRELLSRGLLSRGLLSRGQGASEQGAKEDKGRGK